VKRASAHDDSAAQYATAPTLPQHLPWRAVRRGRREPRRRRL